MTTPTSRQNAALKAPLALRTSIASLLLVGAASSAFAADNVWIGGALVGSPTDWNNPDNWSFARVPDGSQGDSAAINITGPSIATISSNISFTPQDIRVGQYDGSQGRLDHLAGIAASGGGNWMTVGAGSGAVGIYNLANTALTGGTLTGYGQGSGAMTVNSRLSIGGTEDGTSAGGTGTVNVNTTQSLLVTSDLVLGVNQGTGTVNIDSGSVTVSAESRIGQNNNGSAATGHLNLSGGSYTANGEVFVGRNASGNGSIAVTAGTVTINSWLNVGRDGGTGSVNMSGGTMNVRDEVRIGYQGTGTGTLTLSGGATVTAGRNVSIGEGGATGIATVTGAGTSLAAADQFFVGSGDGGNGTLTVSAGTVSSGSWFGVGRDGSTGTLTINGTGVVNQGINSAGGDEALELTNFSKPTTGTVNLDGGTLAVNRIINGAGGTTNLYLNGGVLKARFNRGDFLNGLTSATVKAGGAIIDSDGHDITIDQPLVASDTSLGGGLTKNGNGQLFLTAVNTYTGSTTVNGGILQFRTEAQLGAIPATPTPNIFLNGGQLFNNDSEPTLDANRTVTVGTADGFVRAGWNKPFTINGKITGVGGFGIVWDGAPVILTNVANDYAGNTTIGTAGNGFYEFGSALLRAGADNALPFGAGKGNVVFGVQPLNPGNAATLDLNGHNLRINGLTGGSTSNVNNQSGAGTYTLTAGDNNQTSVFSGAIGQSSGQLAVTKVGNGTLTLSGNTFYNGGTIVEGGRLALVNTTTGNPNFTTNAELEFSVNTGTRQLSGGTISGTGKLIKTGPDQLWLGANGAPQTIALTGTTSLIDVQAGVLRNEYGNSAYGSNEAGLHVATGAVFDIWDGDTRVDELTGSGTINKGWSETRTLTIGVNNGSGVFTGAIYNNRTDLGYGGNGGGDFTISKIGTGTQTFSGEQTYKTLNTFDGVTNLDSALGTGGSTINAFAATNISVSQTLTALNIGDGAVVTLTAPASPFAEAAFDGSPAVAAVPEPGVVGLLLTGLLGVLARRRRQG